MSRLSTVLGDILVKNPKIKFSDWSRILGVTQCAMRSWFDGRDLFFPSPEHLRMIIATIEQLSSGEEVLAPLRNILKEPLDTLINEELPSHNFDWPITTLNHYALIPVVRGFLMRLSGAPADKQEEIIEEACKLIQEVGK